MNADRVGSVQLNLNSVIQMGSEVETDMLLFLIF